jgi:hypothetical protein
LLPVLGLMSRTPGRTILAAIGLAGLTITRPEGAAIGGILLVVYLIASRETSTVRRLRGSFILFAAILVPLLALTIFRLAYYGYLLPNTVHAKFTGGLPSLVHVLQWLLFGVPFFAAWVLVMRVDHNIKNAPVLTISLIAVLAQAIIVLPVHPVMYFLHRYQIAFLPLLVLPVPALLLATERRRQWMGIVVGILLLAWSMQGWPAVSKRYASEKYIIERQRCIVDRLSILPGNPTIALVDAGRIPFWTDLPAIDAWGLCHVETARKGFSAERTLADSPEVYILSVNITGYEMRTHLGMDEIIVTTPKFEDEYALWKACAGGADKKEDHYDYAIFLNIAWARDHDLGSQLTDGDWNL